MSAHLYYAGDYVAVMPGAHSEIGSVLEIAKVESVRQRNCLLGGPRSYERWGGTGTNERSSGVIVPATDGHRAALAERRMAHQLISQQQTSASARRHTDTLGLPSSIIASATLRPCFQFPPARRKAISRRWPIIYVDKRILTCLDLALAAKMRELPYEVGICTPVRSSSSPVL